MLNIVMMALDFSWLWDIAEKFNLKTFIAEIDLPS